MAPSQKFVSLLPLVLLLGILVGGSGCHRQTVHAAPPPAVPPPTLEPAPTPAPMPTTAPPETTPVAPAQPAPIDPGPEMPAPKPVNPKPRVIPPPASDPAPRPAPPQLRPNITPAQAADFKRKTNDAVAETEKNLQSSSGRTLSQEQRDLVDKIRGFLTQVREATDAEDWGKALNLAEKAQLLSREMVSAP